MGDVGPTGGTSGRGVTQYVAGGTFATALENSGITGEINYVHPIVNAPKTKNVFNTISRYFDREMLFLAMNMTGGSAGSTMYYDGTTSVGITLGKGFVLGVKPNTVNQLASIALDKSTIASRNNKFKEIIKFSTIQSAVTGGNQYENIYKTQKIYTDKISSSRAVINDPETHSSAMNELHYNLLNFIGVVNRVRGSIFDGATGGSIDTIYKIQNYLPVIQNRFTENQ